MAEDVNVTQSLEGSVRAHPVLVTLGIIGSLASLVSVPLAVYFYVRAKEYPELTYYVNPVKAVVMRTGQASKLKATLDGNEITTDVTAAQIALWNRGNVSIRRQNILKPIIIYTENNAPILEATVRKVSRDITQLELNTDEIQKGRVAVSWGILEQNDGGIIQIIYAGSTEVNLKVDGIVEGQSGIAEQTSRKLRPHDEQLEAINRTDKTFAYLLMGTGTIGIAFMLGVYAFKRRRPSIKEDWSNFAFCIVLITAGYVVFYLKTDIGPPFGF